MCFYSVHNVKHNADSEDARKRQVIYHKYTSLNSSDFWHDATINNFLITGGSLSMREDQLLHAIIDVSKRFAHPVIVLNGDSHLEDILVKRTMHGEINKLIPSSCNKCNYDLFNHLKRDYVKTIIQKVVQNYGYQQYYSGISAYTDAFLRIIEIENPITLDSIMQLMQKTDIQIRQYAKSNSLAGMTADSISANPDYGQAFREVIKLIASAFSNIKCNRATGLNTARFSEPRYCTEHSVICISTNSPNESVMTTVLAGELEIFLSKGVPFSLIMHECTPSPELLRTVMTIRDKGNCTVGICTENAIAYATSLNGNDTLLKNFPSVMVINNGHADQKSLSAILALFGEYESTVAQIAAGGPPGLFGKYAPGAVHIAPHIELKQRVMPENIYGYQIATMGDRGREVHIYRGYR